MRTPPRHPSVGGFTLIEMMVVVAILVIVATAVVPSFAAFIASLQLKTVSYDLTSDLLLARNEGLKRNAGVRVVPVDEDWRNGWQVQRASDGQVISARQAPSTTVTFDDAPTAIVFDGNGRVSSPGAAVRVTLASEQAGEGGSRCVKLDLSGRARAEKGACP